MIKMSAKYLGVHLGNSFMDAMWLAATTKFRQRVNVVSALAGAWPTQVLSYRLGAVSVLGYIMQFMVLPNKLLQDESAIIAKVL